MKKIKLELKKLNKNYINFYDNFKFTTILIGLYTIYAVLFNFESYLFIHYALFIMIPIVFYSEYSNKRIGYIMGLMLGIFFGIVMRGSPPPNLLLIYYGLFLFLTTVDIYFIIKDEKKISKYLCSVFEGLLQVFIIFMILLVGLTILFELSSYMIFDNNIDEYYYIYIYLLLGIYLVPSVLMSLIYHSDKISKLSDILISKVLMGMMNIYFIIVLIYIFKGLIHFSYSVYSIYIIIGCLFLLVLPLSIMASNYKGKYYEFNSKWLKYIFIIPLILQIYVLVNQINTYGFTSSRYIGLMFIIFEIFSLILLIYKDKKYVKDILLVGAILILIMFIIPSANIRDVVLKSQVNRLTSIYTKDVNFELLGVEDKNRIKNIYDYIVDYDDKSYQLIPSYIDRDKLDNYVDVDGSFVGMNGNTKLDISAYKYAEKVETSSNSAVVEVKKGFLYDFSDYSNYVLKNGQNDLDDYLTKNGLVHINDYFDFYVTYVDGNVSKEKVNFNSIEGYLLYK